ncbi:UNVERIFIED_CONTAM: hypothetical protein ABIC26_002639 [Paenibacillus sp. PvR008]
MINEKRMSAFSQMSKAEYELGDAMDNLRAAQSTYREELMNECIQNILKVQSDEGKLVERDLMIFIGDLVRKVSDIKIR